MADREADDVRFDFLDRPQVAVVAIEVTDGAPEIASSLFDWVISGE